MGRLVSFATSLSPADCGSGRKRNPLTSISVQKYIARSVRTCPRHTIEHEALDGEIEPRSRFGPNSAVFKVEPRSNFQRRWQNPAKRGGGICSDSSPVASLMVRLELWI